MRNVTIVESNVEPNKEHLWFYNGKLKWFGPNGWEEINPQVLSPTTTTTSTPSPVVIITTTTTTSTPSPITTTTTSTPYPSSTTSTKVSTFELINNTGGLLDMTGYGIWDGEFTTKIPSLLNGSGVYLVKIPRNEGQFVAVQSKLHSRLGIIVDGKDKGELLEELETNYKVIPESIYMAATKISVYSIDA